MKIISIKDIVRKDFPIYYRRLYTGVAVMELVDKPVEHRIDFAIEQKPTGVKEIAVSFLKAIDYPLIPLIKELRTFIDVLDSNDGLPD
jgi:hypothetical protein